MTVQVAQIGSLDLLASPYHVQSFDLPDARLNAFGKSAQMAGMPAYEAHYDDPPWEIAVVLTQPTRAAIDALMEAFAPGAVLRWGEGTGTATTRIRLVGPENTSLASFGVLVFSGTRSPAWETNEASVSGTVADGWGTLTLPDVGGELSAKLSLTLLCDSASTLFACGMKPYPSAAYDPIDDYGGALGTFDSNVTLSGTAAALMTPATFDAAANRGAHAVVARVKHTAVSASSLKWQAGSRIADATVWKPTVTSGVANGTETLLLGSVQVPAAPLPPGTVESAYTPPSDLVSITTGSAMAVSMPRIQTFTLDAVTLIESVSVKVSGTDNTVGVGIIADWAPPDPVPTSYYYAFRRTGIAAPAGTTPDVVTVDVNVVLEPGTYAFRTDFAGAGQGYIVRDTAAPYAGGAGYYLDGESCTAGDGTDSTVDYYLVVNGRELITFSNSTPLRATCSESSKTGAIDVLARIPADYGGFVVTGSFDAGKGVTYDADLRQVYPADATGVTGTSLGATTTPLGTELAPVPGVTNTLVIAAGAIADVDVSGTITERRIHRG